MKNILEEDIIEVEYKDGKKGYFKNVKYNIFTNLLNNSYIFMFLHIPFIIISGIFYSLFLNVKKNTFFRRK